MIERHSPVDRYLGLATALCQQTRAFGGTRASRACWERQVVELGIFHVGVAPLVVHERSNRDLAALPEFRRRPLNRPRSSSSRKAAQETPRASMSRIFVRNSRRGAEISWVARPPQFVTNGGVGTKIADVGCRFGEAASARRCLAFLRSVRSGGPCSRDSIHTRFTMDPGYGRNNRDRRHFVIA